MILPRTAANLANNKKRSFIKHQDEIWSSSGLESINTAIENHSSFSKRSRFELPDAVATSSSQSEPIELAIFVVLVKNLDFKMTIDQIGSHFANCGQIHKSKMLLSKGGTSVGVAVLQFLDEESVGKALLLNKTDCRGRLITVELSSLSELTKWDESLSLSGSIDRSTTVFVSKFSKNTTKDDLQNWFNTCGDITEVKLNVDRNTKESKVRHYH